MNMSKNASSKTLTLEGGDSKMMSSEFAGTESQPICGTANTALVTRKNGFGSTQQMTLQPPSEKAVTFENDDPELLKSTKHGPFELTNNSHHQHNNSQGFN